MISLAALFGKAIGIHPMCSPDSYTYEYTASDANVFLVATIFALVCYVLLIIAGWKVFEKAGEKGWKSLIPIYNVYIFYKIVGMQNWFYIMLAVSFVASFVTSMMNFNVNDFQACEDLTNTNSVAILMLLAVGVFSIIIEVIYALRTSKAFGYSTGFAIGLIFLPNIFLLILGFGSSKYDKKYVKSLK